MVVILTQGVYMSVCGEGRVCYSITLDIIILLMPFGIPKLNETKAVSKSVPIFYRGTIYVILLAFQKSVKMIAICRAIAHKQGMSNGLA